jgi:hypothetical protein
MLIPRETNLGTRNLIVYCCGVIREERVFRKSGARLGAWLRFFFAPSSQSDQDKPKFVR